MAGQVIKPDDVPLFANDPRTEHFITTLGGSGAAVDGVRAGWYRLAAKASNPPDMHSVDEMYFITEGSALIDLDGETFRMEAGDTVHVPAGCRHQIHNDADTELVLVFLFAPPPPSRGPDDPPSPYGPVSPADADRGR